MTRSAALVIVFNAAALSSASAQTPSPPDTTLTHRGGYTPPTVTAVRADIAPALDGRLDDAVWQIAIPATGFRRDRPGDGNPASERTEVRVAYTGDALYIGARMYTRDPGQVSRLRGRRDSFMQSNDQFQVQIDSYHDHRTAFVFGVTPAGGRNDLVAPNDGYRGIDAGWDPVWDAATRVDSLGWVAEMRIPFSQLRFGDDEIQVWGINFRRDIFHLGEGVTWSWRPPTEPGWTSQFGHLLGLAGIRRPGRLEIMPYGVTHAVYDQRADPASPFDDGSVTGGTVGVDLKYGLTGGLTLDATFNPDFGQVEADPAVVNLSAFETRFEERRPFFVEGSGLFGFGGLEGLDFFYSRRVGQRPALSAYGKGTFVDQPRASTILGAAKITGRTESDLVVAFMNATTQREKARFSDGVDMPVGETPVDPLTNTTALRIRKDMRHGGSFIGVVATGVVRDLDDEVFSGLRDRAFAGGVDFLHRFGNRTHSVQGWFGGSYVQGNAPAMLRAQASPVRYYQRPDQSYVEIDPELTSMTGYAGELALSRIAGEWTWGVEGSLVSPGFEMNDAGFQTVADLVAFSGGGGRRWVRPGRIFRNANVNIHFAERRNFGNQVLHRGLHLNSRGQTNGFRSFRLRANYGFRSRNTRATRGGPAIVNPAGWDGNLWWSGDGRSAVSGGLYVSYGGDEEGSYLGAIAPSIRGRTGGSFMDAGTAGPVRRSHEERAAGEGELLAQLLNGRGGVLWGTAAPSGVQRPRLDGGNVQVEPVVDPQAEDPVGREVPARPGPDLFTVDEEPQFIAPGLECEHVLGRGPVFRFCGEGHDGRMGRPVPHHRRARAGARLDQELPALAQEEVGVALVGPLQVRTTHEEAECLPASLGVEQVGLGLDPEIAGGNRIGVVGDHRRTGGDVEAGGHGDQVEIVHAGALPVEADLPAFGEFEVGGILLGGGGRGGDGGGGQGRGRREREGEGWGGLEGRSGHGDS